MSDSFLWEINFMISVNRKKGINRFRILRRIMMARIMANVIGFIAK